MQARGVALAGAGTAQVASDGWLVPSRVWWVSFVSACGAVFEGRLGAVAIAVCFLAWVPVLLSDPRRRAAWLGSYVLPWLLPGVAACSCLWSDEPALSARLSTELVLYTALGLIAARAQPACSFVSSLTCALLLGVVASALFGGHAVIGTTGEVAMIGVFGSKNNFASFVCLSLLGCAAMLGDPVQPRRLRALALFGLVLGPAMLVRAHSLGAFFTAAGSLGAVGFVLLLARLAPRRRGVLVALLAVFLVAAAGFIALAASQGEDLSSLLIALGKDPGLTGRTFLWSRAREYMAARPLLGVGYQAFWVQGHVEAEGLWRYAQIDSRSGFHFHNTFYETAVELGWLGLVALLGFLALAAAAVLCGSLRRPDGARAFFAGLFLFFACRFTVEVDFLGPFSLGSFLLPAAWAYYRPTPRGRRR